MFNSDFFSTKCSDCELTSNLRIVNCKTQNFILHFEFTDSTVNMSSDGVSSDFCITKSETTGDIQTTCCESGGTKLLVIYWKREGFIKIYYFDPITLKSHIFLYNNENTKAQ
jgi:hypothetical protein